MANESKSTIRVSNRGDFEANRHFYPRVLNATIHPMVRHFFSLSNDRIIERYCHLHPKVIREQLAQHLTTPTKHFRWGGADLFHTTTRRGDRKIVVIETNSCPSGQKSMPLTEENQEFAGYRTLLEQSFVPMLQRRTLPKGGLAVIYDKNEMEITGYANVLSELTGEPVYLVPFYVDGENEHVRFTGPDKVLEIRHNDEWMPIRACFRYVTQKPWTRLPVISKTLIYNPVLVCLAGGRNKMLAAKAYDFFNAENRHTGLAINFPETIWDVARAEVPLWVRRMGGFAVVKNPYSNAGQGVWTITSEEELAQFQETEQGYDRYIVQSLIGNSEWSSESMTGRYYHVGTVPDRKRRIYVADVRMMVGCAPTGFFPVAVYARRARQPLVRSLEGHDSWSMLGTNLSVKTSAGGWDTESERLVLMDQRDFNTLGLGLDDLIEGYIQSTLAVIAIDNMAKQLVTQRGKFRRKFFQSLNPDGAFMSELML